MTISVPLKDEVTATLRAETSACTDSLAPGCCSRLTSSTLLSGLSLATSGGSGGFLRCAWPGVARTAMAAGNSTASAATFAALTGLAEIKHPLPRCPSLQQKKCAPANGSPAPVGAGNVPARTGAGARRSGRRCSLLQASIATPGLDANWRLAAAQAWQNLGRKPAGARQQRLRHHVLNTRRGMRLLAWRQCLPAAIDRASRDRQRAKPN